VAGRRSAYFFCWQGAGVELFPTNAKNRSFQYFCLWAGIYLSVSAVKWCEKKRLKNLWKTLQNLFNATTGKQICIQN
jgi:hypothetical protein